MAPELLIPARTFRRLAAFADTQVNAPDPNRHPSTSRAIAFSPYQTASGRPRVLGPSSSEASLNAFSRANALRVDLVALYRDAWPVQLTSLPANSFEDLLGGKGEVGKVSTALHEPSKVSPSALTSCSLFRHPRRSPPAQVFLLICTALGARSSSHSEIVQQIGPSLSVVDDDPAGQLVPGGYSEWGIRRHAACLALGTKATTQALALVEREPSFRTLKLAMAAYSLNTTFNGDYRGRRPFLLLAVRTWRKLIGDPHSSPQEPEQLLSGLGHVLAIRDMFYSICYGSPTEL